MKTLFLKYRVLSILVLFVLSVSLNSCGNDDAIKSFLEKQANTDWKLTDPNSEEILYARINNSEVNPFDLWFSILEEACFIHESPTDNGTVEVLENSANELKIKIVEDGNASEYSIVTFSINGDILSVTSEFYEEGILEDEELFILFKTSDDLDALEICAVPV